MPKPIERDYEGYVDLTRIAQMHGKSVGHWLENKGTEELLMAFEAKQETEGIISERGRYGGTWAHPDIAQEFSNWCLRAIARRNRKDTKGCVYLVQSGAFLKIGMCKSTKSLAKRIAILQIGNPVEIVLLATKTLYGGAVEHEEQRLHFKFSPYHVRGEWFDDVPTIRKEFGLASE